MFTQEGEIDPLFDAFKLVQEYLRRCASVLNHSPRTIVTHRSILTKSLRDMGCYDIRTLTIEQYEEYTARRRALNHHSQTINNINHNFRCFLRYCEKYKKLPVMDYTLITDGRVPSKEARFFYPEMVQRVLKLCDNPMDKLIIAILYETGLRIGELAGVQVENINLERSQLRVNGKGNKERTVYLFDDLTRLIEAYMTSEGIDSGYLFQHDGQPYRVPRLRARFKRWFEKAGIKARPHEMRHTHGTTLFRNGADILTVQKLLGHSRIDITQRYLHLVAGEVRERRDAHLTPMTY